jgi:glycosyltransferase involved in cell wall biosynthesis
METKKKILVFVPEFPALSETFIERELSELTERNSVELVIFSLKKGTGYLSDNLKNKVIYQSLGFLDVFVILKYVFLHFGKISRIYKNLDTGPHNRLFLVFKSVGYSLKFAVQKPDLILAHFLSEPSTIAMLASEISGIPFAVSAHAKDVTMTYEYVKKKAKEAKFITVCNKSAYYFLLNLLGEKNPGNIHLNYHGVDAIKIEQAAVRKNRLSDECIILAVGRLTEKKGFNYLINAAKLLKDSGLKFTCYIIGFGPLYGTLNDQISKLGLKGTVQTLGDSRGLLNSNSEILGFMKISDVFVFPSIRTDEGDSDGIANVLLEAGILHLPIIATDVGSTCEIITNKETGLVVPQRDPQAIVTAVKTLLADKNLAFTLTKNAYEKVVGNFDLGVNIVKLEELIKQ